MLEDLVEAQIKLSVTQKAAVQTFSKAIAGVKAETRLNMERADAVFKDTAKRQTLRATCC